ncbi:MAG: DNA pilot protein [Microviridae sp.]|nr:MAG: DNA pilot protein [Microviridae sp.]
MSFFQKIGGFIKKALPFAPIAAALIPGMGGLASQIGGLFSSKQADSTGANPDEAVSQLPTQYITGQRQPEPKTEIPWGSIGSAASGALNYFGQQNTNVANAQQAQKQMDFQASQTGTSYQRGVADMKAAGLNPMLAYSQGGASSGSGAQATMGNELGAGANSALSAAQTIIGVQNAKKQGEQIETNTDLQDAQRKLTDAQRLTELQRPENVRAQTGNTENDAEYTALRSKLLRESLKDQLSEISSAASLRKFQSKTEEFGLNKARAYSDFYNSSVGKAYPYIEAGGETINSAVNATGNLIRGVFTGRRK